MLTSLFKTNMLPKSDGPSTRKKIKLPEIKKDILDLAESHAFGNEETQTMQQDDGTIETTTSNDSTICGSYENSRDLGYLSNEGSLPIDLGSDMGSEANGLANVTRENMSRDVETFEIGDYDYDSILFQFDTFFRGKLDAELASFQENMHSMLTEQHVHLRRIISSACQENVFEVDTGGTSTGTAVTAEETPNMVETLNDGKARGQRCVCQEAEKKAKNGLVIELLSLTCQITELLGQKKFKS